MSDVDVEVEGADEQERREARTSQIMRSLRGPDETVEAKVRAVAALAPAEQARFAQECKEKLAAFLVESEWRAPALYAIGESLHDHDEEDGCDDLECNLDDVAEAMACFT